jgi:2'-5' RNA ligase
VTVPTAPATESAVLALIPEAEPLVGPHRARLDPTAALGVGAHVTVLFPFVAPAAIDTGVVERLRAAVADAPAFGCRFTEVGWFGEEYVWLGPEPVAPFDDLTERVARAFPDHPPYGGEHEPRPHLTVGYRRHSSVAALRQAASDLAPSLPLTASVTGLDLLVGARTPGSWRTVARVPLNGGG